MATTSDRLVGGLLLLISFVVFSYYTAWVFLLPFVRPEHALHGYFLSSEWAIRIPVLLLVVGLSGIFGFISLVLLRSGNKKKQS
ncbi:dolichol phosphate-mannose biosynthesis regulatory [Entophlyctis helioformis]|nr:dolichol phosphate-mannose biosynthesis regulatory [Entophlyctis helioformis]